MSTPEQISQYMSLREPQREALQVLHEISATIDYKTAPLDAVAAIAAEKSKAAKPVKFDTQFPSFCFALATGVGKTRLMGACIYYLWQTKGYRNFFILSPNITIYDKLRAELNPAHPKYMFVGLADMPLPQVYDGDNYVRFNPAQMLFGNPPNIFIFNISKIFTARTDTEFKFHRFSEYLGASFSAMLQGMPDLVVLMDESHRYRAEASLKAINHLKPALGIEFTATPKSSDNVVYSFDLAHAMGRFVKTPTVVTRTNLTTSDQQEIEKLKLMDGMTLHETKKCKLLEYCQANNLPVVKPFVLISTRDTTHASQVGAYVESDDFCEGRYKGKVIEIHSGKTGAESDENVQKLLSVESPTSIVEIVIHVNMLKEGWDVKNLYTLIPLRATISEILGHQTMGRGLRLPFGEVTGDEELDSLDIVSHGQYEQLVREAKNSPFFVKCKELCADDLRPVKSVIVSHKFVDLGAVFDKLQEEKSLLFTSELTNQQRLNQIVEQIVAKEHQEHEAALAEAVRQSQTQPVPEGAPIDLFPAQPAVPPSKPFDPVARAEELKTTLKNYAEANIDVPYIITDTYPERDFQPFDVKVTVGPFELVDQRLLAHDLASGKEHTGDKLDVMEIEHPKPFLAGRLIDEVEEIDAANDKEAVLAIVDAYLAKTNIPADKLGKIVHLYRDVIVRDLKSQIEAHIQHQTKVEVHVRSGFIKFRPYNKTVLVANGILPYTATVQASDIRKYLFEGFKKSFYLQVPFDSTPEKDFAVLLERDPAILKWIRPAEGGVPIFYRGRDYTPDFIVETKEAKYLVEIKGRRDLAPTIDETVRDKALAGIRWCEAASSIKGGKPWQYKLIPEDAVAANVDFKFAMAQAVKVA
ncbi:MAG: DEAD/DEAH box helicase family protein [Kiritimatiellia bacterium]|jgi:type III restriction enzyme